MALLCDLSSVNRFAGRACVIYPDHDHNASLSAFMWTVPCPVWLHLFGCRRLHGKKIHACTWMGVFPGELMNKIT